MKGTGCPDKPVMSIDDDLFDISTYVNALCSFVRTCDTPMTISIQGDWGSGKTSMMNMMRENLQNDVWSIWFNTWQFSQFDMGNGLAFSMLDVLLNGLDCKPDVRSKIINGLVGFGRKAVRVATDVAVCGEAAELVGNLMEGTGEVDVASEILGLKEKFQNTVNAKLQKENKNRVVIFVDDLDRLQPEKAVELLEVLKLFLDCENCVFILAVDYEVVTLGIRQKFGDDVSSEKGKSFFDKIIQLPFKMPVSNYNINKYVQDMMQGMDIPIDAAMVELFKNLIHTSVGFNPRGMKRLFNTYQLLNIVSAATVRGIKDDVRKRELFAIICMQMCYEGLYTYLASTRLDAESMTSLIEPDTSEAALKEIYNDIESDKQQQLSRIMTFLPYFAEAIRLEGEDAISDDEINTFERILKSSLVTSVKSTDEETSDDQREWDDRYINKELVKSVAAKLADIGSFRLWQPRKARDDIKFSDASGYCTWTTNSGLDINLEYYISKISQSETGISILISTNTKNTEQTFFDMLGDNPLKLSRIPTKYTWGRYSYPNALRLNYDDKTAADQIVQMMRNAYEQLKGL